MNHLEIRPAGADELDLLVQWRVEVITDIFGKYFTALPQDEIDDIIRNGRAYYERELARDGHFACFAYLDGERVGCGGVCFYDEMPSPDNHSGRCAYLMNIYTLAAYRKQGIASAVVRYLIDEARKRGAEKIFLETSIMARAMYRSLGFKEMSDYMML